MRHVSRRLVLAVVASLLMSAPGMLLSAPAEALFAGGGVSQGYGFDACAAPSATAMNAWWPNTPWWWVGIYIGGDERGCSQPNLTGSWLNNRYSTGWRFELLWVGPQAPCTGYANRISYNTSTAHTQGENEAVSVYNAIVNLGFGNGNGTPVIYDMEAFDTSNSSCVAAVRSFVSGWDYQLHLAPAQKAGYYGSSCASDVDGMASANPVPDYINGANYSSGTSTSNIPCVASYHWTQHQRLKQYRGSHYETWNGVTLKIDSNCANGPVAPSASGYDAACL